jgi:hypothetical protein
VAGAGYRSSVEVFTVDGLAFAADLPSRHCNSAAAFSKDESLVATSGPELYRTDGWQRIWPRDLPAKTETTFGNSSPFDSVRFAPGEKEFLVSRCENEKPYCAHSLYSVDTGASRGELPLRARRPSFSPGGRWVVAGDTLLDLPAGRASTMVAPGASESIFAPNGDIIAGGVDGSLTRYCREPKPSD